MKSMRVTLRTIAMVTPLFLMHAVAEIHYRVPAGWSRAGGPANHHLRSPDGRATITIGTQDLEKDCHTALDRIVTSHVPTGGRVAEGSGPVSTHVSHRGSPVVSRPVMIVAGPNGESLNWFWVGCTGAAAGFAVFTTRDSVAWENHKTALADFLQHWSFSGKAGDGVPLDSPPSGLARDIVGTWKMQDNLITNAYLSSYEFYDDGTYRFSAMNMGLTYGYSGFVGATWADGTYTVEGDRVTLKWRQQRSDPRHVSRDRLKLLPVRGTHVIAVRVEGNTLLVSDPPGTWPTRYMRMDVKP